MGAVFAEQFRLALMCSTSFQFSLKRSSTVTESLEIECPANSKRNQIIDNEAKVSANTVMH